MYFVYSIEVYLQCHFSFSIIVTSQTHYDCVKEYTPYPYHPICCFSGHIWAMRSTIILHNITVTLKSTFDDQRVKTMLVVGDIVNNERSNDRNVLMNTG